MRLLPVWVAMALSGHRKVPVAAAVAVAEVQAAALEPQAAMAAITAVVVAAAATETMLAPMVREVPAGPVLLSLTYTPATVLMGANKIFM